jgi:hypothetical protein
MTAVLVRPGEPKPAFCLKMTGSGTVEYDIRGSIFTND